METPAKKTMSFDILKGSKVQEPFKEKLNDSNQNGNLLFHSKFQYHLQQDPISLPCIPLKLLLYVDKID
jgi:hypothetical protein